MRVAVIGLALALGGCGTMATPALAPVAATPVEPPVKPVALTAADIKAVHEGARQGLKDPDSAKFGTMLAGLDTDGHIVVCLMINAKNSYGGYTGMKPHMGVLFRDKKPLRFGLVPDDGRFPEHRDAAALKVCADRGLPLS